MEEAQALEEAEAMELEAIGDGAGGDGAAKDVLQIFHPDLATE